MVNVPVNQLLSGINHPDILYICVCDLGSSVGDVYAIPWETEWAVNTQLKYGHCIMIDHNIHYVYKYTSCQSIKRLVVFIT